MAGREMADVLFCIDASGSMSPTFKGVLEHVLGLLEALRAAPRRSWSSFRHDGGIPVPGCIN